MVPNSKTGLIAVGVAVLALAFWWGIQTLLHPYTVGPEETEYVEEVTIPTYKISEPTAENPNLKKYENFKYGFEFYYPKDYILRGASEYFDKNISLDIYENSNVDTSSTGKISIYSNDLGDFYNPPTGVRVKDWVLKDAKDHIDVDTVHTGQSNYELGKSITIGGKETLHLTLRSSQGGYFDDFYLIAEGKLILIQIHLPFKQDPKTGYLQFEELILNGNNWYANFLRSIKFTK